MSLSGPVTCDSRLAIADQNYRVVAVDLLKKRFGDNVVIASSLYFQLRFWWDLLCSGCRAPSQMDGESRNQRKVELCKADSLEPRPESRGPRAEAEL